jgi:hypothetical protein
MQTDEWHNGYIVRKCQIDTCPQPARKDQVTKHIGRQLFIDLWLCHYHANSLQLVGHDRNER